MLVDERGLMLLVVTPCQLWTAQSLINKQEIHSTAEVAEDAEELTKENE